MLGIDLGLALLKLAEITDSETDAARYRAGASDAYDSALSLLGVVRLQPVDRSHVLHRLADLEMCLRLQRQGSSVPVNLRTDNRPYSNLFSV